MENLFKSSQNAVLIQGASLEDIQRMVENAVEKRMAEFYDRIKDKPPVLIKRKVAAERLGISLPTLAAYTKAGFLHAKHLGGQLYYDEADIEQYKKTK